MKHKRTRRPAGHVCESRTRIKRVLNWNSLEIPKTSPKIRETCLNSAVSYVHLSTCLDEGRFMVSETRLLTRNRYTLGRMKAARMRLTE